MVYNTFVPNLHTFQNKCNTIQASPKLHYLLVEENKTKIMLSDLSRTFMFIALLYRLKVNI